MLIYEFQGVVCVDGLVLGRSKFRFGTESHGDDLLVNRVKIMA